VSYANALEEGRDLVAAARDRELPAVEFRDAEVARILEAFERKRSVLIVGPPGVGKTAVVHGLAAEMARTGNGAIRQFSTADMIAGTKYIGEWQTKLTTVASAAEASGTVLYFTDVWNLATVGKTSSDPSAFVDALRPRLESGKLRIIGEATTEVLRAMSRAPGFVNLFDQVDVGPLSAASVDTVLDNAAKRVDIPLDGDTRASLVQLTSRFLPSRPQPGPALNLLNQVHDYLGQKRGIGENEPVTQAFVEKVFCIYSGLPSFVVSRTATKPAREIRAWFQDRIVGQTEAIEAVVETIALFKAGLHDPQRPLGTFFFVGPTGVGKTELARALATFLFGSEQRLLRFDLSEFKDYNSFEMLIGNPHQPDQPARLLDPVRAQPFQVILLDEIEKAHANIWDLLLPLLDEGTLTPPGGAPVSFRNTMVIATSNVGARTADKSLGFGSAPAAADRAEAVRKALEAAFRPEFLNRFQHTVVFHHLTVDQVRRVARHELERILGREGITGRNLIVDVDDAALDLVIERGFDHRYGARALKREIQRQLVLPLAVLLMERSVEAGSILKLIARDGQIRVRHLETADSREQRREREPVKTTSGKKLTKPEIAAEVAAARDEIARVAAEIDEKFLLQERQRLLDLRAEPEFWNDAEYAGMALRDLDRITWTLNRLDRLRASADDIGKALAGADRRRDVEHAAGRLGQLEVQLGRVRRELVAMGRTGFWDALVEVRPIAATGRRIRDLLVDTYLGWAKHRGLRIDWLCEPRADDESALVAVEGNYAYGYLRGEAGVHRLRDGEDKFAAAVRVAAWTEARATPSVAAHRALKSKGQFGGRIRSRLECDGGLVLQNARTLADNRDLAGEIGPSWSAVSAAPDDIVRRYDVSPFMIRDSATGFSSGRPDALGPRAFDELLALRAGG
jgi:ATP-dependent Clp protease ATP-binding subunit ClpC